MKGKICPRCQGRIFLEKDEYGWYLECLQCGYIYDLHNVIKKQRILTGAVIEPEKELILTSDDV